MTTKNENFDFDQEFKDAASHAGVDIMGEHPEETPPSQEEAPVLATEKQPEQVPVPDKTPKSQFLPEAGSKTEGDDTEIPSNSPDWYVKQVAHLRERARNAEARAKELESLKATQTAGATAGETDADDDYLTKAEAEKLAEEKAQKIIDAHEAKKLEAESVKEGRQKITVNLLASEQRTRAAYPDYDAVIDKAKEEGLISGNDLKDVLGNKEPARALFLKAKLNLQTLGITIETPQPEINNNDADNDGAEDKVMSDQEFFDSFFTK